VWARFQERANELLQQVVEDSETILWTSTLTEEKHLHNLPKDYVIQIWTDSTVIITKHSILKTVFNWIIFLRLYRTMRTLKFQP
jgi:hypothetical protein